MLAFDRRVLPRKSPIKTGLTERLLNDRDSRTGAHAPVLFSRHHAINFSRISPVSRRGDRYQRPFRIRRRLLVARIGHLSPIRRSIGDACPCGPPTSCAGLIRLLVARLAELGRRHLARVSSEWGERFRPVCVAEILRGARRRRPGPSASPRSWPSSRPNASGRSWRPRSCASLGRDDSPGRGRRDLGQRLGGVDIALVVRHRCRYLHARDSRVAGSYHDILISGHLPGPGRHVATAIQV